MRVRTCSASAQPNPCTLASKHAHPHCHHPTPKQEWDAFLAALKRPLPITFRINGQGAHADRLREKLAGEFLGQFTEGPVEVSAAGEPPAACRSAARLVVFQAGGPCSTHGQLAQGGLVQVCG